MKKFLSCTLSVMALITGISAVSVPMVYANANKGSSVIYSDANMTEIVEHAYVKYSVNAYGQTYGTGLGSTYVEDLPDLLAVVGDNGKNGYVYTEDFLASPSTPEEASKYQESIDNGTYVPKVLNVYDSDGKTVIDTFTESISEKLEY